MRLLYSFSQLGVLLITKSVILKGMEPSLTSESGGLHRHQAYALTLRPWFESRKQTSSVKWHGIWLTGHGVAPSNSPLKNPMMEQERSHVHSTQSASHAKSLAPRCCAPWALSLRVPGPPCWEHSEMALPKEESVRGAEGVGKESTCNAGDLGSVPGLGRSPWSRERLPTPVFRPGAFHGLYSPWSHKELDTTERLSLRRGCTKEGEMGRDALYPGKWDSLKQQWASITDRAAG